MFFFSPSDRSINFLLALAFCVAESQRVPKCLQDVDDGSSSDEDDDIDPHKDLAYDDMILLVAWPIAD